VEQLELNLELQVQFEAAIDAGNLDTAAFCLRSWIMQAASEHCVGVSKFHTCIFPMSAGGGVRRPVWFDAQCKHKRRVFVEAVHTGQAAHTCMQKKRHKKQTRRARRAYVKHQKAVFLDRLRKHSAEIHALLRKQKGAHQTPITKDT